MPARRCSKVKNGLSVIPADIIKVVTRDMEHWERTKQFLYACGSFVDAIGNLESRDATLGDCLLERLRCAQHVLALKTKDRELNLQDDFAIGFYAHTKQVFTKQF